MEHVVTWTLKLTTRGPETVKGPVLTIAPLTIRASQRDFIIAVGSVRGVPFSSKAQVLLVRRHIGEEGVEGTMVIRELGHADYPVDEYLIFERSEPIFSGTVNPVTGFYRTTLVNVSSLSLTVPNDMGLELAGLGIDKNASIKLNGLEVDAGLSSTTIKLAGLGYTLDSPEPALVVGEGTLNIGVGKVVVTTP